MKRLRDQEKLKQILKELLSLDEVRTEIKKCKKQYPDKKKREKMWDQYHIDGQMISKDIHVGFNQQKHLTER